MAEVNENCNQSVDNQEGSSAAGSDLLRLHTDTCWTQPKMQYTRQLHAHNATLVSTHPVDVLSSTIINMNVNNLRVTAYAARCVTV